MQPVLVHPGLSHRLLVVAARAHLSGDGPLDWDDLAETAGTAASPRAIDRALARLADAGLIEGLHSTAGWFAIRPTERGISRAGRAARRSSDRPRFEAEIEAAPPPTLSPSLTARIDTAREQVAAEARALGAFARRGAGRTKQVLSPRLLAVRTTMAQAWHTFTTLP